MSGTLSKLTISITYAKEMSKFRRAQDKESISPDRAEAPIDPHLRDNHEYAGLLGVTYGKDMEDGAFACCCGHENLLVHYKGKHPFHHLRCGSCDHIFCSKCTATEILVVLPKSIDPTGPVKPEVADKYGQICSACGLTHRATQKFDGSVGLPSTCSCGAKSTGDWLRFGMASPDRYKYDPNQAYVQMTVQRGTQMYERIMRKEEEPTRQDSMTPLAQLPVYIPPQLPIHAPPAQLSDFVPPAVLPPSAPPVQRHASAPPAQGDGGLKRSNAVRFRRST